MPEASLSQSRPRPAALAANGMRRHVCPMTQLDLDCYVPFFLSSIGNKLSRGASRIYLARFGVGVNEWRLLANLKVCGAASAGAICEASGINKAAASRAAGRLQELGLVHAVGDPSDGRSRTLSLTKAGVELHDRIIVVALKRERALLNGLSDTERHQLIELLRKLYANVDGLEHKTG
jgi:DNA-binding MarR family transcriptional regulator